MVLHRPIETTAVTGEVDFGRRAVHPSARLQPNAKFLAHHRNIATLSPQEQLPGQLVLALSHFCSYVQLVFSNPTGTLGQEKKNMKRFGKFRDPRFALTTLQNPSWEVRTRAELIQAAQDALTEQPDAADFPFAGRPAAPGTPPPATTIPPPVPAAPLAAAEPQPQAQSALESEPEPEQHP